MLLRTQEKDLEIVKALSFFIDEIRSPFLKRPVNFQAAFEILKKLVLKISLQNICDDLLKSFEPENFSQIEVLISQILRKPEALIQPYKLLRPEEEKESQHENQSKPKIVLLDYGSGYFLTLESENKAQNSSETESNPEVKNPIRKRSIRSLLKRKEKVIDITRRDNDSDEGWL